MKTAILASLLVLACTPAAATPVETPTPTPSNCFIGRGGFMIPRGHIVFDREVAVRRSASDGLTTVEMLIDGRRETLELKDTGGYIRAALSRRDKRLAGHGHFVDESWTASVRADGESVHRTAFVTADQMTLVTHFMLGSESSKFIDGLKRAPESACAEKFAESAAR